MEINLKGGTQRRHKVLVANPLFVFSRLFFSYQSCFVILILERFVAEKWMEKQVQSIHFLSYSLSLGKVEEDYPQSVATFF
jgi:hypothetical protein